MKRNFKIITIILIILLILFIANYAKSKKANSIENVLIFNLYENSKTPNYTFDISSKVQQKRHVNLYNTIKINSLANDKIAPGTNGEFLITLTSSKDTNYEIKFESLNFKPQNMLFSLKNDSLKYKSLEELETYLKGILKKNSTKEYIIEWTWEYETTTMDNVQDTLDGINIREYNFYIDVINSEI